MSHCRYNFLREFRKYLKNPSENAEKYRIVILVKTYANDQKIIVIIAKR
jgi:hypothetical protein